MHSKSTKSGNIDPNILEVEEEVWYTNSNLKQHPTGTMLPHLCFMKLSWNCILRKPTATSGLIFMQDNNN